MFRITAPTFTAVHSSGLELDVISAQVTLDEGNAPYITVPALVCASPGGVLLEGIDPRKTPPQRVTVALDDRADVFGGSRTQLTADLQLRGKSNAANVGQVTLALASDEASLIDQALLLKNVKDWGKTTARGLVTAVLASLGYSLAADAGADANIDPAAAVQSPGQSYWDHLAGTLEGAGLRLWCDEARVWHLTDKGALAGGTSSLDYTQTMTDVTDSIQLDGTDYYDGLVIRYSYLDVSGNPQTAYDYYAPAGARKVARLDFTSAPAVSGAARRLWKRVQGRGRMISTEAVNRFDIRPTQPLTLRLPDGVPLQTGKVSAITWSFPDDRMGLTSRELSDSDPLSWAFLDSGTWAAEPVGASWADWGGMQWLAEPVGASWADASVGARWSEDDIE